MPGSEIRVFQLAFAKWPIVRLTRLVETQVGMQSLWMVDLSIDFHASYVVELLVGPVVGFRVARIDAVLIGTTTATAGATMRTERRGRRG
jgi:hypothetical protein